ncbi:MAG: hypothetical protein ACFFCS_03220 [Candidatus Hodarchaeota archaeon]
MNDQIRYNCEVCGALEEKSDIVFRCLYCYKKLCNNCNNDGFCKEHDESLDKSKKKSYQQPKKREGRIRKQAMELGFYDLPKTVIFGIPKAWRMSTDPSFDMLWHVKDTFNTENIKSDRLPAYVDKDIISVTIAPDIPIFIQIEDKWKGKGRSSRDPKNHAMKIDIYCENTEHVKKLARKMNDDIKGGMLATIDWDVVEELFNVKREDCISTWNALL